MNKLKEKYCQDNEQRWEDLKAVERHFGTDLDENFKRITL